MSAPANVSESPADDASSGIVSLTPMVRIRRALGSSSNLAPSALSLFNSDPCPAIGVAIGAQRTESIAKLLQKKRLIDELIESVTVEIGPNGPRIPIPNAQGMIAQKLAQGAIGLRNNAYANVLTYQWNSRGCKGRTISAGASVEGRRIVGVGGGGGSPAVFLLVRCTILHYETSFDGGFTWVTTRTESQCTTSNPADMN
ncbi:MAG: hypothetical protein MUF00_19255 [Gemmatimonadaceae bacterium]|nr:hypothetical protein [Gemmatimonadaceae bacterium]